MSKFGDDLILSLSEALNHAKGKGREIDSGANGTSHGHECVWLPEMGTRQTQHQRPRRRFASHH